MNAKNRVIITVVVLAIGADCGKCLAQNPIYLTGLGDNNASYGNYAQPIVGYEFTPTVPISVGALGVFDRFSNGLEYANAVGLWDTQNQDLLAQTTIGTGSLLASGFRWEAIPQLSLTAGRTYVIASFNSGYEAVGAIHQSAVMHPNLVLGRGFLHVLQSQLSFPSETGGPGYIFMGPNFATVVPEPSTLTMLGTGLCLVLWCYRTIRRRNESWV